MRYPKFKKDPRAPVKDDFIEEYNKRSLKEVSYFFIERIVRS